jgi:hypothetical protein
VLPPVKVTKQQKMERRSTCVLDLKLCGRPPPELFLDHSDTYRNSYASEPPTRLAIGAVLTSHGRPNRAPMLRVRAARYVAPRLRHISEKPLILSEPSPVYTPNRLQSSRQRKSGTIRGSKVRTIMSLQLQLATDS